MEKDSKAKLDTILNVVINRNPYNVVLSEPLYNVEFLQLEYFRLSNMGVFLYPPAQMYLELNNLKSRPRLVTNVIVSNDWQSTISLPPTGAHYPLYVKTDPISTGARVIHGKQSHMNYIVEDFGRLSDFQVKIIGPDQTPITFDVQTTAQLVFRVHYQGKRNLDPNEHVRLYSKFQN